MKREISKEQAEGMRWAFEIALDCVLAAMDERKPGTNHSLARAYELISSARTANYTVRL